MDMKRFFLYAIAIAALALAGCGGNGGSGTPPGPGGPEPLVCTAPQMPNADNSMCVTPPPPGPTAEEIAGVTKDAGTKMVAIMAEQAQTVNAGLGGDDGLGADNAVGGGNDTHSLTISRDQDGTKIEIADTANAADDDPKFVDQMADLGMHGDFAGSMHVRTMEADDDGNVESEVVMVRTDIDVPTATPFGMVADQMLDINPKTTGGMDYQSLTIATNDTFGSDIDFTKIMGPATAAVEGGSQTTPYTDDTATQDVNERRFTGTYNGAAGTYVCGTTGGAACSATTNNKGEVMGMVGDWSFTPEKDTTSDVADANYLAYGFWLKRTLDSDGRTTYNEVETYAMAVGHTASDTDNFSTVTGTATYEGGSAGVYVKNTLDNQGNITAATSGHFTADVELNASFGGGNVPDNQQYAIEGTVDKFVLNGQFGPDENDWAVKLGLSDFSGGREGGGNPGEAAPGASYENTFNGVATGDSTAAAGKWNGAFYGSTVAVDHDDNMDTPNINPQPVAVIGEFNANFTDGAAAGGFGANKE